MCFSQGASLSLAALGAAMTGVAMTVPLMRAAYLPVVYAFYAAMELLQAAQYWYVNDCASRANVLLTDAAYLLVIVQPLMWNAVFYLRDGTVRGRAIFTLAAVLCAVWIVGNVTARLYASFVHPAPSDDRCGFFNHRRTCTYRDTPSSHLYWRWTTRHVPDLTANYFMYLCLWIVPALLVPSSRVAGSVIAAGAAAGAVLTWAYGSNRLEFPAVWCYISVPILALGFAQTLYYIFLSTEKR